MYLRNRQELSHLNAPESFNLFVCVCRRNTGLFVMFAWVECSKSSHEAALNIDSWSSVIAWGVRKTNVTYHIQTYIFTISLRSALSHEVCKQFLKTLKCNRLKVLLFFSYRTLIEHTKALDPTRPVTYITDSNYARDKGVSFYMTHLWINKKNLHSTHIYNFFLYIYTVYDLFLDSCSSGGRVGHQIRSMDPPRLLQSANHFISQNLSCLITTTVKKTSEEHEHVCYVTTAIQKILTLNVLVH